YTLLNKGFSKSASSKKFRKELDELLDKIIEERVSKDRIVILTNMAMELWYEEKESEDYSLAFSFDENGIPNSVSLEIYGRTHSEITIPDYKLKEEQE
ncbi:unnamed protein product, partial [marine sediment metagenome]